MMLPFFTDSLTKFDRDSHYAKLTEKEHFPNLQEARYLEKRSNRLSLP